MVHRVRKDEFTELSRQRICQTTELPPQSILGQCVGYDGKDQQTDDDVQLDGDAHHGAEREC